jgi:hypothetical protein
MAQLATDLLAVWERGLGASPVERGLLLLSLAMPAQALDELARVAIGDRDAQLLTLRERAFGSRMTGRVSCPACSGVLELEFGTTDARVARPAEMVPPVLAADGFEIAVRSIDSTDLAMLSAAGDLEANVRVLLARCVLSARQGGEAIPVEALPARMIARVSEYLSIVDPQSDVQIAAECPDCAHAWHAPFDVASYLWSEVHAWACRLLRDIHAIASAYGWLEREIVALSPTRRQAYLDLIQS